MDAILIDAEKREIRKVTYGKYRDIGQLVGGLLCSGWSWDNGDVLFVDDEGYLKSPKAFFLLSDRPDGQPLAGNGVVTGADTYDDLGNETTAPPTITVEQLRSKITWLTPDDVVRWGRDNASKPAVRVTSYAKDGTVESDVVSSTWGDIISQTIGE